MKKIISTIMGLMLIASAQAQNFTLQIEEMYGNVYESLSGVVIVSDENCEVPDYSIVTLRYYNNPADSAVGPYQDNFIYTVDEPSVVEVDTGYYDINGEPVITTEIVYTEVTKQCDVYGVARLSDAGSTPVVTNSRAVIDVDSGLLHLYNIEIWEQLTDTNTVYPYARMSYNGESSEDGKMLFFLEEYEEKE